MLQSELLKVLLEFVSCCIMPLGMNCLPLQPWSNELDKQIGSCQRGRVLEGAWCLLLSQANAGCPTM